jgi:hypothetical protein
MAQLYDIPVPDGLQVAEPVTVAVGSEPLSPA